MGETNPTPVRYLSSWMLPRVDESPTVGGGSFAFERADLVIYWQRLRAVLLAIVDVGALLLIVNWGIRPGHPFGGLGQVAPFLVLGLCTGLLVDAILRVRRRSTKVLLVVFVDMTAVAVGLLLLQMPLHLGPVVYVALAAVIVLPVTQAVWVWGYGGLLSILVATGPLPAHWLGPPPTAAYLDAAEWLATGIFAVLSVTQVLVLAGAIHRFSEARHARLSYQVQRKDEFLSGVSHTLRTPLASIVGFGRIIDEEWGHLLPAEAGESLAILNQQADTMSGMVDNLLVKAHDETGELTLTMEQIELRSIASDVIRGVAWLYPDKVIRLTGDRRVEAWADPARIRQVIRNLVSNAVEHGGDLVVLNLKGGAGATLTVTDDGTGPVLHNGELPLCALEKCTPVVASPSMGFGLPISLRLAQLHGGSLTHCHTPGNVTFTLTLPSNPPRSNVESNGERLLQEAVV